MLPDECAQFLGVLQHPWNLDGSSPIHVVEALAVDEFLDDALLEAAVAVGHAVVGGLDGAAVALLGNQIELKVSPHCVAVDDGAGVRIDDVSALVYEELL
jgi:hypothetical protein